MNTNTLTPESHHMDITPHAQVASEILKTVPPLTVSAITLFGYPLEAWTLVATLTYTVLMIIILIKNNFFPKGK